MAGQRKRRRLLVGSGVLLIVAGVALLGYVGWQLYGTTWVSKREQHKIVEATRDVWEGGGRSADQRALADGVVALVRIPRLGEEYVVPAHRGTARNAPR